MSKQGSEQSVVEVRQPEGTGGEGKKKKWRRREKIVKIVEKGLH